MKSFVTLSALAALVAAAPHQKRDVVWVTEYNIVTKTIDVTETVWLPAGAANTGSPAPQEDAPVAHQDKQHNGLQNKAAHNHGHKEAAPSSEAPVVVAQAPPATTPATTEIAPTTPAAPAPITTTTSVYSAPPPPPAPTTTTEAPAPAPVEPSPAVQAAPSNPAPAQEEPSAPASYSPPATGGSSSGGDGCVGDSGTCNSATFSYYNAGMGSCGISNTDSDYIFAYGLGKMQASGGANPNANPMCGRKIAIKCYDGTEVTATLTDSCPACNKKDGMLDLTPALWDRVAKGMPGADGILSDMTYRWL